MVHARNVKPPFACAKLTGIDEASVKSLPGFIKVVSKGNYVAVVCEREEQAIRAARQLKTTWEKPATAPFPPSEDLFEYMRSGDAHVARANPIGGGQSRRGIRGRGQGHRSRVRSALPGTHGLRRRARHGRPVERPDDRLLQRHEVLRHAQRCRARFSGCRGIQVRVVWMQGPQGYGRTAAEDAGCEAAWIARETRPAGPHAVDAGRGDGVGHQGPGVPGQDARRAGCRRAVWWRYDYNARSCDYNHVGYNEPDTVLIAQLMGSRRARPAGGQLRHAFGHVRDSQSPDGGRGRRPAARLGNAAAHRQSARSERSAVDVRRRIVHRRTGGGGESRSVGIPHEAARGRRLPTTAASGARAPSPSSRRPPRLTAGIARPSPKPLGSGNILTGRGIAYSFRGQTMVGADRRSRSESPDRSRLGEAARVRARLRSGGQSREPAARRRVRHAARR